MRRRPPLHVTITGADDAVDPGDLLELSRKHLAVEWGLLASLSNAGQPRYPSLDWLRRFEQSRNGECRWSSYFALHLCGQLSRDIQNGDMERVRELPTAGRIQINGYAGLTWMLAHVAALLSSPHGNQVGSTYPEFILQANRPELWHGIVRDARLLAPNASVLYDVSGGRGIEPDWKGRLPRAQPVGPPIGYAGGIGPHNVEDVLTAINDGPLAQWYWIDMESGVRNESNRFDMQRVREVLERVHRWTWAKESA